MQQLYRLNNRAILTEYRGIYPRSLLGPTSATYSFVTELTRSSGHGPVGAVVSAVISPSPHLNCSIRGLPSRSLR